MEIIIHLRPFTDLDIGQFLVLLLLIDHVEVISSFTIYLACSLKIYRYGSWGVCYTYATWFGIKGLVASGKTYSNSYSIRKACDFLLSKQFDDSGGWGESYLSCHDKVTTLINMNHI